MKIYLRISVKAKKKKKKLKPGKSSNGYLKCFMLIIITIVHGRHVLAYVHFSISIPTEIVLSCGFSGFFCKFNLCYPYMSLCVCVVFGFVRQYVTGINAAGSSSLRTA